MSPRQRCAPRTRALAERAPRRRASCGDGARAEGPTPTWTARRWCVAVVCSRVRRPSFVFFTVGARAFSHADGWGRRLRPHRRGKKVEGKRGESPGGHSRVDRLVRSYEDRALLLAGAAPRSVARRRSAPVARAACVGSESCRALCERRGAVGRIAQSKRTAERPRCIGIARWFV